ncbi:MAG: LexA family protein [Candidatus Nitrospinota bacterium M3_3B_026]
MINKSGIDRKALGGRIRKIRADRTLQEFGEMIGVSHTSVKRYEAGALPDINTLLRIAGIGGMDLGRLLTGEPLPADVRDGGPLSFHLQGARPGSGQAPDGAEYISVPLTEGRIAAGAPIIAEEDVIDHVLLHVRALKRAGASRNLIACRVQGDSMTPHLSSGDIVVIDRGVDKEKVLEKKIYAIFDGEGITAKMLQRDGYLLYLIPLNISERIQSVDLRENENPIVGLVIGAWRNFEGRVI